MASPLMASTAAAQEPAPQQPAPPAESAAPTPVEGASPAVAGPAPAPNEAAAPGDRAAPDEPSALSAVVVLGQRGGPPRTVAESPAPIDVISSDDLLRTGRAELGEALAKALPSFNFGSNQAGITSIVRPVTNRGLGPAYTLVLVNGKRRHNGAQLTNGGGDTSGANPVDLDLIPVSAVAYIEVLKDSAAAQYGSDAVAGVINVVLKDGAEGGSLALTGGRLYSAKGNPNSVRAAADVGVGSDEGAFVRVSADGRYRGLAWWNFPATAPPYAPAENPKNATWNGDGAHNGDPEIQAFNLAYNAELPLGALTLYSFGTGGGRWTQIGNNYRRPNGTASFSTLFPDGYFPFNDTAEYDLQFVAGGRGEVDALHYDLSSSYGRNHVRQYSTFTINPSLGPTSPQSFDDLARYRFEQWVQNIDLTQGFDVGLEHPLQISGGFEYRVERFTTFAGDPLGSANGGYVFAPGDQEGDPNVGRPASLGAQAGVVLREADEARLTREVLAAYLDIGIFPAKIWYAGLAARVEHYTDSGDTFGGKLNTRVDVLDELAFRGTAGTGFRAPSLTQLGYAQTDSRTNTNPVTGEIGPSLSVLARNDSELARELGAEDLKPEKSVNFGLGAVFRPLERLNVTVDAYQVDISDRIGRTQPLLGPAIESILVANGLTGTEFVQYFANQADTRTRGVDVVAVWGQRLDALGNLNLSLAFNYNRTTLRDIPAVPAELAALPADPASSLVFFGRATQGDLTVNQPRSKLIIGVEWLLDPITLNITNTRYGGYDFIRSQNPEQDTSFGARWLTDVELTLAVLSSLDVTVGALNIFDVRPDENGPLDPNTGSSALRYGPAPFAPSGGSYYGKLAYYF